MKIAYLGKIQLSDVDLSYLHEAQKLADVDYIMEVNPRFLKGPAFNIGKIYPKSGLFKAVDIYPEMIRLQGQIDLERFYILNTCGRFWLFKSFVTNILLLVFLIRGKYTRIHLAWPPHVYELVLYFLSRKMLLTVHDPFPHTGNDSAIVRFRRKLAFRLIPRLIILNRKQRQDFLDFYRLSPERVIDSQLSCYTYLRSVASDEASFGISGRYILFAGKISRYKGLDYLLPAMKRVHRECPDCRLIVAGGGKFHFDTTEYETLDFIGIRNRFIPDDEMVALIKNCAFMVCPYTDATQSGVIMSAFAFNKPVIATNVGGLPEMVKDRHYGLIIKEKNVDALAESIVSLWRDPELAASFSEEIRRDYSTGEKSWRHIAALLFKEYA